MGGSRHHHHVIFRRGALTLPGLDFALRITLRIKGRVCRVSAQLQTQASATHIRLYPVTVPGEERHHHHVIFRRGALTLPGLDFALRITQMAVGRHGKAFYVSRGVFAGSARSYKPRPAPPISASTPLRFLGHHHVIFRRGALTLPGLDFALRITQMAVGRHGKAVAGRQAANGLPQARPLMKRWFRCALRWVMDCMMSTVARNSAGGLDFALRITQMAVGRHGKAVAGRQAANDNFPPVTALSAGVFTQNADADYRRHAP
jgi:hypothetical protein